jgi:methylmalonyl-CoA mutase cobalamin-binding subunit
MDSLMPEPGPGAPWLRPGVARALEGQVIPRLLARHRSAPPPAGDAVGARWLAGLAVADDDGLLAAAVDRLQRQGHSVESLQLDWLGPAAVELGRLWDQDDCSFADVTVGLVRLQCCARRLGRSLPPIAAADPSLAAPRILLAPVPGEQHGFGLFLVADAFRRAGWDVSQVEAGRAPLRAVAAQAFDLVGLSIGSTSRADGVPELCTELRRASCRPGLGILLGGPLFALPGLPAVAATWGADAVAPDARAAVALAAAWMTWRGGSQGTLPMGGGRAAGR